MYTCALYNIRRGTMLPLLGNYQIYEIDGLSPEKANIVTSKNNASDGTFITSKYVDYKTITIKASVYNPERARIELYNFMKPKDDIRFIFYGQTRTVYIDGVVEDMDVDYYKNPVDLSIALLCPVPYFSDFQPVETMLRNLTPEFKFTFFNNKGSTFEFGSYAEVTTVDVYNAGDVETGLTIKLSAKGAVTNPKIINTETLEYFGITVTMATGDDIILTTGIGNKKIEMVHNAVTTNIFSHKTNGSTWLELDKGNNNFTFTADSGADNLSISLQYTPLYIGV